MDDSEIIELMKIKNNKERMKKAREFAGFTQKEIADKLYKSRTTIVAYENKNSHRFYNDDDFIKLSKLYNCPKGVLTSGVLDDNRTIHNATGLSQASIEWLANATGDKKKIIDYIFSNKEEADYLTDIILCFIEPKIPKYFLKDDKGNNFFRPSLYLGDEEALLNTVLINHLSEMMYGLRDKNIIDNQREIDVNDPQYIELMDNIRKGFEERHTSRGEYEEMKMQEYLRDITGENIF